MWGKIFDFHENGVSGEFVRFGVASILSASLSLLLPVLFHGVGNLSEERAVALGFVFVFFVNFWTMRAYVFRSGEPALKEMAKFALTSGLFRIFDYVFFLLVFRISELHYILVLIFTLTVSSIAKFAFHRSYTFCRGSG